MPVVLRVFHSCSSVLMSSGTSAKLALVAPLSRHHGHTVCRGVVACACWSERS